jgi:dynein heavy chain 2, cytosolic
MRHLFGCIGSTIAQNIQKTVSSLPVWENISSGDIRLKLQRAIRLFDKWLTVPKQLTATYWNSTTHPWKGPPYEDAYVLSFRNRLRQILGILSLTEELFQLLSPEDKRSFKSEQLYAPLRTMNPFLYNPYTDPIWMRAMKEFEANLATIESTVATNFRKVVAPLLSSPQLLLREFEKYKNLMERPIIRRSLASERDALFSLLNSIVRKFEITVDRIESGQAFDPADEDSLFHKGGLMSSKVAGIVLLKQVETKVASVLSTSKALLDDLAGFTSLGSSCENLIYRIRGEVSAKFDSWVQEMQRKIEDEEESFRLKGSLMTWTKDGILTVNFSDELVRFLREIRQLDDLGFDLPKPSNSKSRTKNITDKAIEAQKFYRYGILLKKTANFFNSIKEQMIDVQEQLLLDSLKSFVTVVSRRDSDVSWTNPAECEIYIRTLQGIMWILF